tara:strand:+ start:443 stop:874 length:432 start_codon:yes stop_codon:yes gene_type:complete
MNILVINGPNLNLLGLRNPDIYGQETLEELMMWLENSTEGKKNQFKFYQSNHEGEIIDILHDEIEWAQGIIINAGAYAHYSYAIRDAISSINIPAIEVHLSDIYNRENFRKKSVISDVCIGTIAGKGKNSYLEGLKVLTETKK